MTRIRFPDFCLAAALALLGVAFPGPARAAIQSHTVTNYLTHCGGCHGIEGISGKTFVPTLRDQVGWFACSPEGRDYLVRVPGISMSLIRDDQELADVLNFVLFRLGGISTPQGTKPFTAQEVHVLRAKPLQTDDLMALRAEVLSRARAACPH
ncbi:c-type cytochrome [Asaia krungthepensis]|uniref:Cytochrome c class I n=1 Tax=Asaia krungthepensis NRIC 0535 TaxID=1307925 RepID=A0ABQ0PVE5_9PROT|nr:cytochrome c [Asaia krungthepensis]GBQ82592.1 cytochrome c class I [Asaia krungthepensis NRIC 0535]